jgi:hypothetical protein
MAKKKAAKKKPVAKKVTRKVKSKVNKAKHKNVAKKTVVKRSVKPKGKGKGNALASDKVRKDFDIEVILTQIIDGLSYRDIAASFGKSLRELHEYITTDEPVKEGQETPQKGGRSARVREALIISAHTFEQMAEDVLIAAEKGKRGWKGFVKLEQAKQLAQHYRWRASKRFPKGYGDKVQQEHSGLIGVQQITGMEVK